MSTAPTREEPILKADGLSRHFPVRNAFGIKVGSVRALDGVSFAVQPGETLGIVGESGCGKSTLGKALAGIHALSGGAIEFEGEQISRLSVRERRAVAPRLQYCHQDPGNSLDPRWTIRRSLEEPLIVHTRLTAAERMNRIRDLLRQVGLPQTHLDLYPHELSGGQQRRVGLARILALHPRLVVLDEPTSGLDMSVQATVLKLFNELRETFSLTYLFISHDLSVVRMMCDRVAVMYLGRIVEISPTEDLFGAPQHPYTQSLLAAIPDIGGRRVTDTFALEGEPPDPARLPSGCRFRTRCPRAAAVCAESDPALRPLLPDHAAACLLAG
jgi:oligopeptide/dipeptide ABC transporter ATP-binding protein